MYSFPKHRLLAMGADEASPSGLEDSILVCRGALVVSLAPDEVPNGRDEDDSGKNDRGVVHRGRSDREVGRHAKERSREAGPGCDIC